MILNTVRIISELIWNDLQCTLLKEQIKAQKLFATAFSFKLASGSQVGVIILSREFCAMPRDISSCHNWKEGSGSSWV